MNILRHSQTHIQTDTRTHARKRTTHTHTNTSLLVRNQVSPSIRKDARHKMPSSHAPSILFPSALQLTSHFCLSLIPFID